MSDIFISFIHEEAGYASAVKWFLMDLLAKSKTEAFMSSDQFQVYAGEKWLDRIMEELGAAKVVLLMLSEKSVTRPWVNFEAGAAWTRGIVTIPVCYGGLRKEDLPKPYSSLQAVDIEIEGEDEYLVRSAAHHLKVEEPMPRSHLEISDLLGDEGTRNMNKLIRFAYDVFRARLIKLKEDPAHDADVTEILPRFFREGQEG